MSVVEKIKQNRDTRIALKETERLLLETNKRLQREKEERMQADRKLKDEQENQTSFIAKVISEVVPIVLTKVPVPENGKDAVVDYEKIMQGIKPMIPKVKEPKQVDRDELIRDVMYLIPKPKDAKQLKEGVDYAGIKEIRSLFDEEMKTFKEWAKRAVSNLKSKRGGSGNVVYTEPIGSQANGITKSFTVPPHRRALLLVGSDFPFTWNYTVSGTILTTLNDNAPPTGCNLDFLYVK